MLEQDSLRRLLECRRIEHVERDRLRAGMLAQEVVEQRLLACRDDDARAGTVKRCSQRAADAARRADQPDDAA